MLQKAFRLSFTAILLAIGVQALADNPADWSYYEGDATLVYPTKTWTQLSTKKNYCGGRIRAWERADGDYNVQIQGSWCKEVRFGLLRDTDRKFVVFESTTRPFPLKYNSSRSDSFWSGYFGTWIGHTAAATSGRIRLVLMTDKRDDTGTQGYELISIVAN